jgi:uncharacterized repeat protein (TIGR01451 family)
VDDPIRYDIYVMNCGDGAANNVSINDFVPVGFNVGVDAYNTVDSALFENTGPTAICVEQPSGAGCVVNAPSGPYLNASVSTLQKDEYVRIRVERIADDQRPGNATAMFGDLINVGAAADVAGELNFADNSVSFDAELVVANNQGPPVQVALDGAPIILEDAVGQLIAVPLNESQLQPVTFSVMNDPEGDDVAAIVATEDPGVDGVLTSTLVVQGLPALPVSAGNQPIGGLAITASGQPDAFGTTRVRLVATDGGSPQVSGQTDFELTVVPVNDAPTFSVASVSTVKSAAAVAAVKADSSRNVIDPGPLCTARGNSFDEGAQCANQSYALSDANIALIVRDWFSNADEGAVNESAQVLSFDQPSGSYDLESQSSQIIDLDMEDVGGAPLPLAGSIFRQPPELQDLNGDGVFDLFLDFRGVIGEAYLRLTVRDDGPDNAATGNGDVNETEVVVLIEVVDNLPPTVTVSGSPDAILEDSGSAQLAGTGFTISAADAETAVSTVTVTSLDQAMIADADIGVNASNLSDIQVTVQPQADVFGSVDLEVIAYDDSNNPSIPKLITVDITNVNDRPSVVFGVEADVENDADVSSFDRVGGVLTVFNGSTSFKFVPDVLDVFGDDVLGINEGGSQFIENVDVQIDPGGDPSGVLTSDPGIDPADGSLVFQLTSANATGTVDLSIVVTDNGGVVNGGQNTSTVVSLQFVVIDPLP